MTAMVKESTYLPKSCSRFSIPNCAMAKEVRDADASCTAARTFGS